jgi:nucleoside-diphosphate-sugar epimerase
MTEYSLFYPEVGVEDMASTVLVTGGSGFVASHVIVQLLQAGHTVRTTVRSAAKEETVRQMMRDAGVDPDERLSFAIADLLSDTGWAEACAGCACSRRPATRT